VRSLARRRLAGGTGAVNRSGSDHAVFRGDVIERDWYKGVASPIRLERSKPSLRSVPPTFGQDTHEVLMELGYSRDEIDALTAKGAVCGPERRR
jgi:crotonobetainyl-CoA:carnitine CoA-transferase CaiB-like acyl-CoA transferase